ncbi:MAG: glutamate racemase [bacterium]
MFGFFDSGVGGLTVLEAFRARHGDFSFHYFADTAHCPYGDRPLAEVKKLALDVTGFLASRGCKTIVMACNISSSVAIEEARRKYPDLKIYGLLNDNLAREVKKITGSKKVGVLATAGTVASNRYGVLLEEVGLEVYQQPCSPLVPMIEAGHLEGQIIEQTLEPLLEPVKSFGAKTIVLGCTHYPFLSPIIQKKMGKEVELLDPGQVLADHLSDLMPEKPGDIERSYWISGETESLSRMLDRFYQRDSAHIEVIPPARVKAAGE